MYVAHLRDMCNFDPIEVGTFLQEMRTLVASAEEVARRLKILPSQEEISPKNAATGRGAAKNENMQPRRRDGAALKT